MGKLEELLGCLNNFQKTEKQKRKTQATKHKKKKKWRVNTYHTSLFPELVNGRCQS